MQKSLNQKQFDKYWNLSNNLAIDCARACLKCNQTDEKHIIEYLHTHYQRYGLPASVFARLLYDRKDSFDKNILERVEFYLQSNIETQKKLGIISISYAA